MLELVLWIVELFVKSAHMFLNKICSYLSSLLGQFVLSSILCVHKVFLVNICSIIIQMMCTVTCICVFWALVKDLDFTYSESLSQKINRLIMRNNRLF